MPRTPPKKPEGYDETFLGDICLTVYRQRLRDDGHNPDDQVEKDADGGAKQSRRAMGYKPIIQATLDALNNYPTNKEKN